MHIGAGKVTASDKVGRFFWDTVYIEDMEKSSVSFFTTHSA